jgi:hypothetical protein
MNTENMLEQLRLAMKNQPSLSMTEVINEALDLKFCTRKYDEFHLIVEKNSKEKWRPTNDDIYSALVTYNKVRHLV